MAVAAEVWVLAPLSAVLAVCKGGGALFSGAAPWLAIDAAISLLSTLALTLATGASKLAVCIGVNDGVGGPDWVVTAELGIIS